jgi:hypothetical protein
MCDAEPNMEDINHMLDTLTHNLRACDQREEDATRWRASLVKSAGVRTAKGGDDADVIIQREEGPSFFLPPPLSTSSSSSSSKNNPKNRNNNDGHGHGHGDDNVMIIVEAHQRDRPRREHTHDTVCTIEAPPPEIIVSAGGTRDFVAGHTHIGQTTHAATRHSAGSRIVSGAAISSSASTASIIACDDAEPWTAPGEWWDAGVRCVFEWLREAFAAALDRDVCLALRRCGVTRFFEWPPVSDAQASGGGASAACSLTLMLRPWTPADRPAEAERGRGGGPSGIGGRRRDAESELAALTASAEQVVSRVEALGDGLANRHAALSEAVRGCAACLRTLLRLAHDESHVLRTHGAATREAAVIATRAVAIAQKWIFARAVERVARTAARYESMDATVRADFDRAEACVRGQRLRFLSLWRDLKARYDAFLAAAGLDGADPAAAQAMEALFWRGAGGEPAIDASGPGDPASAVAAAADAVAHEHDGGGGIDPDAFDGDALRLLRYYCEHMANVARSMLDRTTEDDDDDKDESGDPDKQDDSDDIKQRDRPIDADEIRDGRYNSKDVGNKASASSKRRQRRRPEIHSAVDDAVSSVSSEARRHIAACVAGGDDRARVLAEMRRARDRCRATARQIAVRRRERARLLRPVRRRHARRMALAQREKCQGRRDTADPTNINQDFGVGGRHSDDDHDHNDDVDDDDDLLLFDSDDDDDCDDRGDNNDNDDDGDRNQTVDRAFSARVRNKNHRDDNKDDRRQRRGGWDEGDDQPRQQQQRRNHHQTRSSAHDRATNDQADADRRQLDMAMAADAADARIEAAAQSRLADLESLMAGMAAQAVESGPHAEWMRATQRLGDALTEAQDAWRQAAEARAIREAVLEEETARCLESVATTAREAHQADVGAVLCQWNERQHGIDRRRAEDLRQIAMARRVADEWLANFERKMVYYHEDAACAEAVGAVGEFRAVMGLHAGARGTVVRLAEFTDAYEDLTYAWSLAYRIEYGDEAPPDS